jgi:prephenate dehydrogenase
VTFGVPLGIAGVGLVGGSIALRARDKNIEVVGFDAGAAAARLVNRTSSSLEELCAQCATLVIALPLDATLAAIDGVRQFAKAPSLVIDVASVKAPVARRSAGWESFVGTHPIAGSEQSGPGAARADLFVNRAWAYVPSGGERDAAVRDFIAVMGGLPFAIDAETHDEAVAMTSHLPQVVVSTLAAMLAQRDLPAELAGPGLASTLRLAGSGWDLWEPIVRANSHALAAALRDLGERFTALADDLEEGDVRRLASYFQGAHGAYETFVRGPR